MWKVTATTGVYEPDDQQDEENLEEEQAAGEEEAEEEEEEEEEEEDENTNNNANDRSETDEAKINDSRQKRKAKYRVVPKPPTCGVHVVLYGDRGKTSVLPLLSDGPASFKPGCADEFKVFHL